MASSMSPKSLLSPKKSTKNVYKWMLVGLLVVLGILLVVSFTRAKREGFEGGAGNLMYFHMPECGHCKKFNPEWEKLQPLVDAERVPMKLNKIDGTDDANKDLVDQYKVNGYPTIILEIGDKSYTFGSDPTDGDRNADNVLKWAKNKLGVK